MVVRLRLRLRHLGAPVGLPPPYRAVVRMTRVAAIVNRVEALDALLARAAGGQGMLPGFLAAAEAERRQLLHELREIRGEVGAPSLALKHGVLGALYGASADGR